MTADESVLADPAAYVAQISPPSSDGDVSVNWDRLSELADQAARWKPDAVRRDALSGLRDLLTAAVGQRLAGVSDRASALHRGVETVGLAGRPDRISGAEIADLVARAKAAEAAEEDLAPDGLLAVLWAADVQLRICANPPFWAEFRKRLNGGRLGGPPVAELVYALTEAETVVFARREEFEEIRTVRAALRRCRTWGDARRELTPERMAELSELVAAPGSNPPDDQALKLDDLLDQGWPTLHYGTVADCLPAAIVDEYGESYSTMMDSGVNFHAERKGQLLAALRRAGYTCHKRQELEQYVGDQN